MTDYLPDVYQQFSDRFPAVKAAFDSLGAAEHEAGPLGEKERRLIKLGIAVGAESEGAVRSHVRKLLGIGVSEVEILHASPPSASPPPTRPWAGPKRSSPKRGARRADCRWRALSTAQGL